MISCYHIAWKDLDWSSVRPNLPPGLQNITNNREFHVFKDPSTNETIVEGPPMSYCVYKMGVMISCDE